MVFVRLWSVEGGWHKRQYLSIYKNTSTIRKEDLHFIWCQDPFDGILPTDEHEDFAIRYLDVVVEPKNFNNENKSNHYFVPCMVKTQAPTETMDNQYLASRLICLSDNLENMEVPSALAFKLIGAVTSIKYLKKN